MLVKISAVGKVHQTILVTLLDNVNKYAIGNTNTTSLNKEIINGLMPILSDKTGRVPIILPIVMGIKTHTKEDDNNSKKDVQSKKVINKKEIPNKNK